MKRPTRKSHGMTRNGWLALLLGTSCALGCSERAGVPESIAVNDSAGVPVVTHASLNPPVLATSPDAEFVIGTQPDPSDDLFRVRGGILQPDGSVVLANGGSSEILYFSGPDEPVHRFGGEGEGPREFDNILWIQPGIEDGLIVSDAGNQKLVYLDGNGDFVRSTELVFEPEANGDDGAMVGRGFAIGVANNNQAIAAPWAVATPAGIAGPLPLRGELRLYSPDQSSFTPLDSVRFRTWYEIEQADGPPIAQVYEAPVFVFSASRSWTAYSDATAHRITVLEHGQPSYVIQEARTRTPFDPDSIPSFYPIAADSFPAYRSVQVDSDGRIWVQSGAPDPDDSVEWRVFAGRGREVRALALPASTRLLDARGHRVLLLERDEFDVERVAVRRLISTRPWSTTPGV